MWVQTWSMTDKQLITPSKLKMLYLLAINTPSKKIIFESKEI